MDGDSWLNGGQHVMDDLDDLDCLYMQAPAAVFNEEPPPPLLIHEDLKLETQYSEGSEDECEDDCGGPALDKITEMLRQVEPIPDWNNSWNKPQRLSESEDSVAVLTKPKLNPDVPEFVPELEDLAKEAGQSKEDDVFKYNGVNNLKDIVVSMDNSINQPTLTEAAPQEREKLKRKNQAKPKTRNLAIDCLLKMRALQEEVLKNKTMKLLKPEHFSTPPSAATTTPPLAAPLTVETQTSPPEASTSAFSPPAQVMEQSRGKVEKWLSRESPSGSPKGIQRESPRRTLMTEVPLVVKPPTLLMAKPPTLQQAPGPRPPVRRPPKAQEFVSSSKASELYAKYSQVKREIERENAAGRTASNTVSDFIEVKLNQKNEKKETVSEESTPTTDDDKRAV